MVAKDKWVAELGTLLKVALEEIMTHKERILQLEAEGTAMKKKFVIVKPPRFQHKRQGFEIQGQTFDEQV